MPSPQTSFDSPSRLSPRWVITSKSPAGPQWCLQWCREVCWSWDSKRLVRRGGCFAWSRNQFPLGSLFTVHEHILPRTTWLPVWGLRVWFQSLDKSKQLTWCCEEWHGCWEAARIGHGRQSQVTCLLWIHPFQSLASASARNHLLNRRDKTRKDARGILRGTIACLSDQENYSHNIVVMNDPHIRCG